METRANYILIGAFALAGMLGLLAFLLWFAKVELDRQFAYYDINFPSVSGLGTASDVRFSGLPVGQVVSVGLSPAGDGSIRVRIEVRSDTPVRNDSLATIEAQGVTGVSFVGISAGTPDAPLLTEVSPTSIPEIPAGLSVLQALSEDAPALLSEALSVVENVNSLLSGDNQGRVDRILSNLEVASGDFATALEDFSTVTGSVSEFATQIDAFNETLELLTGALTDVLATADDTLVSIGDLAEEARQVLSVGVTTMGDAQGVIIEAERYITEDLSATTTEMRDTLAQLRGQIDGLSAQAGAMLDGFTATGLAATARLDEAQATITAANAMIARLDETLVNFDGTVTRFDTLMQDDGAALLAETRVAVAEATTAISAFNTVARDDLPAIVADIRSATREATEVIATVGADLTATTGQIAGQVEGLGGSAQAALDAAIVTFANANETLAGIDAALVTGEAALVAAQSAFEGADRVINEDVGAITADLRVTLGELNAAIAQVSGEIPGITTDLRAASTAAEGAFAELARVIAASGGSVETFATSALPQYARLAQESRTLIDNLDRLTTQISRDPARFFLNQQTPDFRR